MKRIPRSRIRLMMDRKGRAVNDNDSEARSMKTLLAANILAVRNTRLISVFPGAPYVAKGALARRRCLGICVIKRGSRE